MGGEKFGPRLVLAPRATVWFSRAVVGAHEALNWLVHCAGRETEVPRVPRYFVHVLGSATLALSCRTSDSIWWWNCCLGHMVILCDLAFQTMFCFDGYKVILFYGTVWGAYGKLRKYFCLFANTLRGRKQLKHGNYFGFPWNSNVIWLVRGNLSNGAWRLPLL